MSRVCGWLTYAKEIPVPHDKTSFHVVEKPLTHVTLALYGGGETECCKVPIETAHTRKNGRFDFKIEQAGDYWLKTNWKGKDYKIRVAFKPSANSANECPEQGITLFEWEGVARWWGPRPEVARTLG
jgi:hypothetical protein